MSEQLLTRVQSDGYRRRTPVGLSTAHIGPRADGSFDGSGFVSAAIGAGVGNLKFWHTRIPQVGGSARGTIAGFSRASRLRMMRRVAGIKREVVERDGVWFITLTYPSVFSEDWGEWKGNLKAFRKRLERRYGKAGIVWRLEFQKRGAPHFHLLWYRKLSPSAQCLLRRWVSRAWYEVVGSGDEKHLKAGTNCTLVRSWNGVNGYVSKAMALTLDINKVDQDGGGVIQSGRVWGSWYYDLIGAPWFQERLSRDGMMRLRRVVRRLALQRCEQYTDSAGRVWDRLTYEFKKHSPALRTAWAFARWETWSRAISWATGREWNALGA